MIKIEKIVVANYSEKPLLVMLEPWGEDYTLKPKEEFEIIAEDCGETFIAVFLIKTIILRFMPKAVKIANIRGFTLIERKLFADTIGN